MSRHEFLYINHSNYYHTGGKQRTLITTRQQLVKKRNAISVSVSDNGKKGN